MTITIYIHINVLKRKEGTNTGLLDWNGTLDWTTGLEHWNGLLD